MSNNRVNAYSMVTPDPYGNMSGSMVPIVPQKNLIKANNNLQPSNSFYNDNYNNIMSQKTLDQPVYSNRISDENITSSSAASLASLGKVGADYSSAIKGGATTKEAAGQAGIGLASAAATIGGGMIKDKAINTVKYDYKGEVTKDSHKGMIGGSALKGAGTGATMGASFGPWGAAIGAVVGAGVGAGVGASQKKKLIKSENAAERDRLLYNKNLKETQRVAKGQNNDILNSQALFANTAYSKGGSLNSPLVKFQIGGSLSLTPKPKAEDEQARMLNAIAQLYSDGHSTKQISEKMGMKESDVVSVLQAIAEQNKQQSSTPVYKGGGKIVASKKLVQKCNCGGKTKMFRRGGVLDLEKENVIVDGPSHDQHNKTGVKGDKGIPVVKDGKKMAEIESSEWVLNKKSSERIQELRDKALSGDDSAKEELGKLVAKELGDNTYDYTKTI